MPLIETSSILTGQPLILYVLDDPWSCVIKLKITQLRYYKAQDKAPLAHTIGTGSRPCPYCFATNGFFTVEVSYSVCDGGDRLTK